MNRPLLPIIGSSLVFILLILSNPIWTRYPGGLWILLISLLVIFILIWLLIKFIKEIFGLIKNRKTLKPHNFLPILIIISVGVMTSFIPDTEDFLFGKVTFRACYSGTGSLSIKLRGKNRFEIHSTGIFFYDKYFIGQYSITGDTLNLNYNGEPHPIIGQKLYMNNIDQFLIPLKPPDRNSKALIFNYGYCKP
jgi:hypothetical protein